MLPFAASLLGGVTLGVLSVGRLIIRGQVLGVSGYVRNLVKARNVDPSKAVHIMGIVAGGFVLAKFAPSTLETIPASYSILRAVAAGLLVGVGSAIGGGCTSGHGICGNARLSPRSLVFTVLIIVSGAASARLSTTAAVLNPVAANPFQDGSDSSKAIKTGLGLLAAAVATLIVSSFAVKEADQPMRGATTSSKSPNKSGWKLKRILGHVTNFAEGLLFSLALGLAGMTKPSKVVGFLTLQDLSAAFVMGGAVLVSLPIVLPIYRAGQSTAAKAVSGSPYPKPPTNIDAKLLLGGVLFGLGWGLGGLCPGPALAGVAKPSRQSMACLAAMLASFYVL